MHCKACDKLLSDRETTRRDEKTEEYIDLCDGCLYDELQEEKVLWDFLKENQIDWALKGCLIGFQKKETIDESSDK